MMMRVSVAFSPTGRLLAPLFCKISPAPVRPVIVPPTVKVDVVQFTRMPVILAVAVPPPPVTTQVCVGLAGCENAVTLKELPLGMGVGKVKIPFLLMGRLSPLLS